MGTDSHLPVGLPIGPIGVLVKMVRDWEHFAELSRSSARSEAIDPDLPVAADELIALGYEKWSAVRPRSGQRRTLEVFEAVLRGLYSESIPSLYRKVKGAIHPRGHELERLLTALLVASDGEGLRQVDAEVLGRELSNLYLHRSPDIVDGTADAWLLASEARLVHGPDDHTRDETFRELMSNRLRAACNALGGSRPRPLALTVWAVDVTEACSETASSEAAHEARRELMVLAAALMGALERPLHPPTEKPSLEFSSRPTIFSPDIRIGLNPVRNGASGADLREMLLRTSVVCFIGDPRTARLGQSKLHIEGHVDGNLFRQALMPATFVDAVRRDDGNPNRGDVDRVLASSSLREICLGARLPFLQVHEIGVAVNEDADQDVLQKLPFDPGRFDPQFYLYSYEGKPGDRGGVVSETLLQRIGTPPAIRLALFALLCGATATLREQYGEAACEEASIGREMCRLLASNDVQLLTVDQFLDLRNWPSMHGDIPEILKAGSAGGKEQ